MGILDKLFGYKEPRGVGKPKRNSLGPLKRLEDITLQDMRENPIWVCDLSGEWEEGYDETSQRPLTEANHVTEDMLDEFVSVSVLIKFTNSDEWGSADVDENGNLCALAVWRENEWIDGRHAFDGKEQVELEVIPVILGGDTHHYVYCPKTDTAI